MTAIASPVRPGQLASDEMTSEARQSETKPVGADVPEGIVDQRIDWAAMLSGTGVSQVAGEVTKAEQIRVPAETFETIRAAYRIKKSNETESYEVWASKEIPGLWFAKIFAAEYPRNSLPSASHSRATSPRYSWSSLN